MRGLSGKRMGDHDEQHWENWIENHVRATTKIKDLPDELIGYLGSRSPKRGRVLLHLVVWLMAEEYGQRVYEIKDKQVAGKVEQVKFALIFESLRRRGKLCSYPGMDASLTRFVSSRPPSGTIELREGGQKRKLKMAASAEQRHWLKQQLEYLRGEKTAKALRERPEKRQEQP